MNATGSIVAARAEMTHSKVVLAYSGGLDTSVAVRWLQEKGLDVIALTVDVGQPGDLEATRRKAEKIGAKKCYVVDAKDEFAEDYIARALKANALYEGQYPLSTALARPLIGNPLVDVARREGASFVAHGCTGKGNDQVRFDLCTTALAPELQVIAPARVWGMSREEEIEYAKDRGVPVPVARESPYSTDENLWGRSVECGILENAAIEPPEEAFEWTTSPADAPDEPAYVNIRFEAMVLPRDLLEFKRSLEARYANLIYEGLWFTPLREALDAFIETTQERVTGEVSVKLYKGSARVVGRTSPYSLYDLAMATYSAGDRFRQEMAEGFIYIWGLPARTWTAVGEKSRPRLVKAAKRAK